MIDNYKSEIRKIEAKFKDMSSNKDVNLEEVVFNGMYEFPHKIVDYIHFFKTKKINMYQMRIFLKNDTALNAFYDSQKIYYQYAGLNRG